MTMSGMTNYDIRGRFGADMTPEDIWNIGKALAEWLPMEGAVAVVSRGGAPTTALAALIEGLQLQGRDVVDGGMGDQETMQQIVHGQKPAGGVLLSVDSLEGMVSLEFYHATGTLVDIDGGLRELAAYIASGNFVPAAVKGTLRQVAA